MLNLNPFERTCLAVRLVLTKKYGLDDVQAQQMIKDSTFYQTLLEDPHFVGHRSADYWADEVLEEYRVLH